MDDINYEAIPEQYNTFKDAVPTLANPVRSYRKYSTYNAASKKLNAERRTERRRIIKELNKLLDEIPLEDL